MRFGWFFSSDRNLHSTSSLFFLTLPLSLSQLSSCKLRYRSIMEVLSFSFLALLLLKLVAAQSATDPIEGLSPVSRLTFLLSLWNSTVFGNWLFVWVPLKSVAALKKLVDYWDLGRSLNLTTDPCSQGAAWSSQDANPRVACDCVGTNCHITHL